MQQKKRIWLCLILIIALVLPSFVMEADAALTSQQQYFFDYICPRATDDMEKNGILASVTLSQAIIESGWGGSSIAQNGKNLFGMRAYESYVGKVYNSYTKKIYSSMSEAKSIMGTSLYNQYYNKFWRAYSTWDASINAHSELFNTQDRYKNVRNLTDYTVMCHYIVAAGYCNDLYTDPDDGLKKGYAEYLIDFIEKYDLCDYDVSGSNPINESFLVLDVGDTYTLGKRFSCSPRFVSDDTSIATVDSDGKIKALKEGIVSIKAYTGSSFDETIVFVKKSSEVAYYGYTNEQVNCRKGATTSSNVVVKLGANMFVVMIGSPDSNGWYKVYTLGMDSLIAGYSYKDYIRKLGVFSGDNGKEMPEPTSEESREPYSEPSSEPSSEESSTPVNPAGNIIDEERIVLVPGDTYTPDVLSSSSVTYSSNNTSVASVDAKGKINALKAGAAVVKAVSNGKEDYLYVYVHDEADTLYNGKVKSTCNFRSSTDTSSTALIGRLTDGDSVILMGKADSNEWYHLYDENDGKITVGYAYADYISMGSVFTGDNKEQGEEPGGDTYTSNIAPQYEIGHNTERLTQRETPDINGKWVSSFFKGTVLLLIDGIVNERWVRCVGDGENGKTSVGYSAMKGSDGKTVYIEKDGNFMDTIGVELTEKDGFIYGLKPSTTVSQLDSIMKYASVEVYDVSGVRLTKDEVITNGCNVRFLWRDKVYVERRVIILGDVSGDGIITVDDYLRLKLSVFGVTSLSDISSRAACVTGGDTYGIEDYIALRLYLLGKYNF